MTLKMTRGASTAQLKLTVKSWAFPQRPPGRPAGPMPQHTPSAGIHAPATHLQRNHSVATPAGNALLPSAGYSPIAVLGKRAMDITLASLLLLCLSVPLLILALLVKLTSDGPVFYLQERVGQHGRSFRMYKFRSMKVNADAELMALLQAQGTDKTPFFKVQKDPRLTSIGRFLRRYSLDELPQLLNVLGGSMSLVGPRPQRPHEVALYDERARRRLLVPPGMSGLWQVSGRSSLGYEESLQLDLRYVDTWSLLMDIVILLRTFKAVFACTGAL